MTASTLGPTQAIPSLAVTQATAPQTTSQRVHVFVDGANLFNAVKRRFGYTQPNCDVKRLAQAVTALTAGRTLSGVNYYIGVPRAEHDAAKNNWWNRKLSAMGRSGVTVVRRDLKPRELKIQLHGMVTHESSYTKLAEKGIDLRLGLDLVRKTLDQSFDVAIIFTQDNDLAEAVEESFLVAQNQRRRIVIESAFPTDGGNHRGVRRCNQVSFDKTLYDSCIDPNTY